MQQDQTSANQVEIAYKSDSFSLEHGRGSREHLSKKKKKRKKKKKKTRKEEKRKKERIRGRSNRARAIQPLHRRRGSTIEDEFIMNE